MTNLNKRLTIEQIASNSECCCSASKVRELLKGKKTISLSRITTLDSVPEDDRIYFLLNARVLPDNILHNLACDFAEHVLHLFEDDYPDDTRPREAIQAKRDWLKGLITDDELRLKRASASASDWAMASYSSWARASVWSRNIIWASASDSAWESARDSASYSASAKEREWQLNRIKDALLGKITNETKEIK